VQLNQVKIISFETLQAAVNAVLDLLWTPFLNVVAIAVPAFCEQVKIFAPT